MAGVREHTCDRDLPNRRHESITLDSDILSVLCCRGRHAICPCYVQVNFVSSTESVLFTGWFLLRPILLFRPVNFVVCMYHLLVDSYYDQYFFSAQWTLLCACTIYWLIPISTNTSFPPNELCCVHVPFTGWFLLRPILLFRPVNFVVCMYHLLVDSYYEQYFFSAQWTLLCACTIYWLIPIATNTSFPPSELCCVHLPFTGWFVLRPILLFRPVNFVVCMYHLLVDSYYDQ